MRNDEKSVSSYKFPILLALLPPMDNVLCIIEKRVAGLLQP